MDDAGIYKLDSKYGQFILSDQQNNKDVVAIDVSDFRNKVEIPVEEINTEHIGASSDYTDCSSHT